MLGAIFGRKAGSVPGFKYSPALADADLIWSADNLDRWLTNPGKVIAGVRMPVSVLDASARRDIIAYLQKESRQTGDASGPRSIARGPGNLNRQE
jgi:cytochrome c2